MHTHPSVLAQPWVGAAIRVCGRREHAHHGGRVIAVVPAHNEGATVHQAVEALAAQARVPDEVIVVADNCTDDTAARAMAAGARVVETRLRKRTALAARTYRGGVAQVAIAAWLSVPGRHALVRDGVPGYPDVFRSLRVTIG
nr:glycosyltransferase [Pedococcus badiiscoriae]